MKLIEKINKWFRNKEPVVEDILEKEIEESSSPDTELNVIAKPVNPVKERLIEEIKSGKYDYLFEDEHKLETCLDMSRYICSSLETVMVCSPDNTFDMNNMILYSMNESPNLDFMRNSQLSIRNHIINSISENEYNMNLEHWDYDLAMVYKEADYHMLRADYYKMMNEYILTINDPNGMNAPQAAHLYREAQKLKEQFESYN